MFECHGECRLTAALLPQLQPQRLFVVEAPAGGIGTGYPKCVPIGVLVAASVVWPLSAWTGTAQEVGARVRLLARPLLSALWCLFCVS